MNKICPKPGHLVQARNRSQPINDYSSARNTAIVVDKRGVDVQVMINGRLTWVRRDLLEVVDEG